MASAAISDGFCFEGGISKKDAKKEPGRQRLSIQVAGSYLGIAVPSGDPRVILEIRKDIDWYGIIGKTHIRDS